jgi:hypothetical protein
MDSLLLLADASETKKVSANEIIEIGVVAYGMILLPNFKGYQSIHEAYLLPWSYCAK